MPFHMYTNNNEKLLDYSPKRREKIWAWYNFVNMYAYGARLKANFYRWINHFYMYTICISSTSFCAVFFHRAHHPLSFLLLLFVAYPSLLLFIRYLFFCTLDFGTIIRVWCLSSLFYIHQFLASSLHTFVIVFEIEALSLYFTYTSASHECDSVQWHTWIMIGAFTCDNIDFVVVGIFCQILFCLFFHVKSDLRSCFAYV